MLELLQFRHSPYNEKVRWALDLKQVPHRRRSLLPGPHVPVLKRLSGQTGTPLLLADGVPMAGSAALLRWLDERYPQPPLFPADRAEHAEALRIERWIDEAITPRIRRAVLDQLLREPDYFAAVFGEGLSARKRWGYARLVPVLAPLVRRGNGIRGAESVADGLVAAEEALAFVAERAGVDGYLCGSGFTSADLTVAATLAVLVRPANSPMASPQPVAPGYQALIERFAAYPAAQWTRRIYGAHRQATRDFEGISPWG